MPPNQVLQQRNAVVGISKNKDSLRKAAYVPLAGAVVIGAVCAGTGLGAATPATAPDAANVGKTVYSNCAGLKLDIVGTSANESVWEATPVMQGGCPKYLGFSFVLTGPGGLYNYVVPGEHFTAHGQGYGQICVIALNVVPFDWACADAV